MSIGIEVDDNFDDDDDDDDDNADADAEDAEAEEDERGHVTSKINIFGYKTVEEGGSNGGSLRISPTGESKPMKVSVEEAV